MIGALRACSSPTPMPTLPPLLCSRPAFNMRVTLATGINAGRQPAARQPTNYTVGIDIGQKQWNTKELARLDLRRSGLACGQSDGTAFVFS